MDFRYTPEQERFRTEIRAFLRENVSDELRREIAVSGHSPGPLGKAFLRLLGERQDIAAILAAEPPAPR